MTFSRRAGAIGARILPRRLHLLRGAHHRDHVPRMRTVRRDIRRHRPSRSRYVAPWPRASASPRPPRVRGCRFVFRFGNRWIDAALKPAAEVPTGTRVWAWSALTVSWVVNLGVFALCMWWSVASARGLKREDTEEARRDSPQRCVAVIATRSDGARKWLRISHRPGRCHHDVIAGARRVAPLRRVYVDPRRAVPHPPSDTDALPRRRSRRTRMCAAPIDHP